MTKNPKQLKYEQAIAQVEQIIEQIESGEVGLEESITKYEQGMKLLTECRTILDKAEKKIASLTIDSRGKSAGKQSPDKSSKSDSHDDNEVTPDDDDQSTLI